MSIRLLLVLAVVASLAGAAFAGYRAGVNAERAAQLSVINDYKRRVGELLEDLEHEKSKRRVVVREKIRVVRQAADPTNCKNTPIPAPILEQLR